MADNDREHRIRERAYRIWEEEGRPEGRHERHWHQASQEAGDELYPQPGAEDHDRRGALDGGLVPKTGLAAGSVRAGAALARMAMAVDDMEERKRQQQGDIGQSGGRQQGGGLASGLQPGGTIPGQSPAAGEGSLGTGGGSTAGAASGTLGRRKK